MNDLGLGHRVGGVFVQLAARDRGGATSRRNNLKEFKAKGKAPI